MTKSDIIDLSGSAIKSLKSKNLDFFIDDPLLKIIEAYEKEDIGNKGSWDHINEKISNYQNELRWISNEIRADFYQKEHSLLKYYNNTNNLTDIDFIPGAIIEPSPPVETPAYLPTSSSDYDNNYCINKAVALISPYWKLFYKNNDRNSNTFPVAIDPDGYSGQPGNPLFSNLYPGSRAWNGYFYKTSNDTWEKHTETNPLYSEQIFLSSINYTNMITAFTDFQNGVSWTLNYEITSNGTTLHSTSNSSPLTGDFFVFNQITSIFAKVHISDWTGTEGHPGSAGPPPTASVPGDWNATLTVYYGNGLISGNVPAGTYVLSNGLPLFTDTQKASNDTSSIMFHDYEYKYIKAGFIIMFDAWLTLFKSPTGVYKKLYDWMNSSTYIGIYSGNSAHITNINAIYNYDITPISRYNASNTTYIINMFSTRSSNAAARTTTIINKLGSVFNLTGGILKYDPDGNTRSGLYLSRYKIALTRYNKNMGSNSMLFRQWEAKEVNNAIKDTKKAAESAALELLVVSDIKQITLDRRGVYIEESSTYNLFVGDVIIISDDKIQEKTLYFKTKVDISKSPGPNKILKGGIFPNSAKTIGVETPLKNYKPLMLRKMIPWSWDTNTPGNIRIVKLLPEAFPVTGEG
jgi:hypothetical protein